MTVPSQKIYLYAATEGDFWKAMAAAQACNIPVSQVTGDFQEAWRYVADGQHLVIAVGGAALYALYYNPCNWQNPAAEAGGHTPFSHYANGGGIQTITKNFFVNAAGYTALDSLKLATMLTYYAINGVYPYGWTGLPIQETPQAVCVQGSSNHIDPLQRSITTVQKAGTNILSPEVGLYAVFDSVQSAESALQIGWSGLASTAALGISTPPYTELLSNHSDQYVAAALANNNNPLVFWISFWTVSWPEPGDSFQSAGHAAGVYAANQLANYPGTIRPSFVVIDPEGYNQPATTSSEWKDFISGWREGLLSVDSSLQPGFYCNQFQYQQYQLSSLPDPAFIAISPISGNQPEVTGGNIRGYIAYTASCPVISDIEQVKSWGATYNTVQFADSGVDCGPNS
ncbi:hypothetical protein [Alicyclobacillus tolerans]|uniref:Uncharacterized protein n=2 Tax=Alicyclobacillus tolerans TaxID=90970 RepID=A0A1M6L2J7_9BACL|nr:MULTISPECIES: hypothetical protein [Alicyclobacillus]MDP9727592.1 hypothetical protein [Alicyclobacillus tengchongensis]SHJ65393.1 hypothetical protein SAMN05443507_10281 [Alicyclobacillus montanus]